MVCINCSILYNNDYTTTRMDTRDVQMLLTDIGLAPAEVVVYQALLGGAGSVAEIMKTTAEKRPTVYYSLNSLEKRGLVHKTGKDYGGKFQVAPLVNLSALIGRTIKQHEHLLEQAKQLETFYPLQKSTGKVLVTYFDRIETITAAISYTLYSKDKIIRSIVPAQNFFHEMGRGFVEDYVHEKQKRKIKTIALWEDIPKRSIMDEYYNTSDIKQLPIIMHNRFATTIFIYDDKTLYVSPKKDCYAVLMQSTEHAETMRAVFDSIWGDGLRITKGSVAQ